ncbi:MAG: type II toxin-antitoxin system VapC family toxin [Ignavibacteriaceae bacterium]|nr:type II toxin-antitoxin system VapC family toxin [Ignavibacteriaceae bacterium]
MNGSSELPEKLIKIIADMGSQCFLSIASIWEIAVKLSLGKLEITIDFSEIQRFAENNKIEILPISFEDTRVVRDLAFHHRDPFDRIIIAQSITNKLTIITADRNFRKYETEILWN